jgi:hypothetical protein
MTLERQARPSHDTEESCAIVEIAHPTGWEMWEKDLTTEVTSILLGVRKTTVEMVKGK